MAISAAVAGDLLLALAACATAAMVNAARAAASSVLSLLPFLGLNGWFDNVVAVFFPPLFIAFNCLC